MRYLLKDVDSFAGFAHAINTYVAGVALADLHRLRLIYQPLRVAHGMGHAWDDFFASDPRGFVRPLIAPSLTFSNVSGLQIDGTTVKLVQILNKGPKEDASKRVNATLSAVTSNTLVWLRKGRSTFLPCTDGCEIPAELIYAGLWLRERFWQAVQGRHRVARSTATGTSSRDDPANVTTIAIHVRRGDVTWLDRAGEPSHRWVDTESVLEVLRGVQEIIGLPLALPAIRLTVHSERGWLSNDTRALRQLAPYVTSHGAARTAAAALLPSERDEPLCVWFSF